MKTKKSTSVQSDKNESVIYSNANNPFGTTAKKVSKNAIWVKSDEMKKGVKGILSTATIKDINKDSKTFEQDIEVYSLIDSETGEVRIIGNAKNLVEGVKDHIGETVGIVLREKITTRSGKPFNIYDVYVIEG